MTVTVLELLVVLDIVNPVEEVFTVNIPGKRRSVEKTAIETLVESFASAIANVEEVVFPAKVKDCEYCKFVVLNSDPKILTPL